MSPVRAEKRRSDERCADVPSFWTTTPALDQRSFSQRRIARESAQTPMDDPTLRPQLPRTVFQFESTEAEALAALEFNQTRLGRRLRRSAAIHALGIVAGGACPRPLSLLALLLLPPGPSPPLGRP